MQQTLNLQSDHDRSVQRLKNLYDAGLIAPEKKPFLIDLRRSSGPFMAVDGGGLIFDGASQIASHGLGFNPGALFGASQFLESWINQTDSENVRAVRSAFEQLLRRKLGSKHFVAHFCASGAEAIETALAYFFDRRANRAARRVLAFRGSFHGRMMVALASTWNPAKRKPFTWPGFESTFAPYPEMDSDAVTGPQPPPYWPTLWSAQGDQEFQDALAARPISDDELLNSEVAALTAVRHNLARGQIFAIMIEPMQCEGGDRYASARFHQGLAYLATTYDVPLIYDEIQTGFGLGGEFFWHRMFELHTRDGKDFFPSAVICAKKAQTGIVLTHLPGQAVETRDNLCGIEQISAASLFRGYIQASVIDQFVDRIAAIETLNRKHVKELMTQFPQRVSRPRLKGLAFAFDLESAEVVKEFVGRRFQHGLLYYPAGNKTARFRLNLGYRQEEIELFWEKLSGALGATFDGGTAMSDGAAVRPRDPSEYYSFHEQFVIDKLHAMRGQLVADRNSVVEFLSQRLQHALPDASLEVLLLDRRNYASYREQILQLQKEVYEPARQSTPDEFDADFNSDNPLSILVLENGEIMAMAFAAPLPTFHHQRGVEADPCRDDPSVAYMLDLTVADRYRGRLGRLMKQAIMLLAQRSGFTAIHGRNRDRLAAAMWAINLSLGSYTTQYLVDDYPDDDAHRDCLYYRCPIEWPTPSIDLSSAIEMPLGVAHLDEGFVRDNMPTLINKVTLSNFVTDQYLQQLEQVAALFPSDLRHLYAASGLSECVDKIGKVLWRHRQPRNQLVTIEGSEFGHGSLMSRSLSGIGEPFFPVKHLPIPAGLDDERFFDEFRAILASDEVLGVLVEPLMRRTMERLPRPVLERLVSICHRSGVPIVFNETASLLYRYSTEAFSASGLPGLQPNAVIAYLGGQMGIVCCSQALYLREPLLLISTWDGDAFSLAQFHQAASLVERDRNKYLQTLSNYHGRLTEMIERTSETTSHLQNGIGSIEGTLPEELVGHFRAVGPNRWISCPSYSEMLRFLEKFGARSAG